MKGVYKQTNKMGGEISWGRRRLEFAHKNSIELRIRDEHQQQVAFVEARRQPDNTIALTVYGTEDEPLFEAIVKRGADVVRAQNGTDPKGAVPGIPIAPGAPGRRRLR